MNHPDLTGTYLMEWDFRKGAYYNFTAGSRGWVGLNEPEDEDYCGNMGKWINSYVDKADADLFDGSASDNDWMSRIDLNSAVDYYIAMEYLKPVDGNMWASVYMYKPRGGEDPLRPAVGLRPGDGLGHPCRQRRQPAELVPAQPAERLGDAVVQDVVQPDEREPRRSGQR